MEFEAMKTIIEFGIVGACFVVFLFLYIKGTQKHMEDLKGAAASEKEAWKTTIPVAQEAAAVLKGLSEQIALLKDRDQKLMALLADVNSTQDRGLAWLERELEQLRRAVEGRP